MKLKQPLFRTLWCAVLLMGLLSPFGIRPALAGVCLEPTVDGNLQDLIDYVACLQTNGLGCGLSIPDPTGEITVTDPLIVPCEPIAASYYKNGFDQELGLVALNGSTLYLGIRVVDGGIVGDPDGNDDPDNSNCVPPGNVPDQTDIGSDESYRWFIDTNCDGIFDVDVTVSDNAVTVFGLGNSGTSFAFNGRDLEVSVSGVSLAPLFAAQSFAGAIRDGLGEDLSQTLECPPPDLTLEIVKSADPTEICGAEDETTTFSIVVRNTSVSPLDINLVDFLPAGLVFCGNVTGAGNPVEAPAGTLTFPAFNLAGNTDRTITFCARATGSCNGVVTNLARVTGTLTNPCLDGGSLSVGPLDATADVTCRCDGGFACPHTIGFWRQQCAQKGNGSTKVCRAGMENLWRCVITETDVIQWKKNDGSFETTASLAALSNANLFVALCSQLDGPRPMTLLDMAEIQYLGLMLNVCSGALPLDTEIANGFDGTVAEAIDEIEEAINTGVDLDFWKTVADEINNRVGVIAADCLNGDSLFRNVPPCNPAAPEVPETGELANPGGDPSLVYSRAYPNPIFSKSTEIEYIVPSDLGGSPLRIDVFDLSGRMVRSLVSESSRAGRNTVSWNLDDGSGNPVPAGVYFYRISVRDKLTTKKLLVARP